MPASAYATVADLANYLPDATKSPQNNTALGNFLEVASRYIDMKTGQFFYSEQSTIPGNAIFFDSQGEAHVDCPYPFYGKIGTVGVLTQGATSMAYTSIQGPAPVQGDQFIIDVAQTQETVTINGAVTGNYPGPFTCPIAATANAHVAGTSASTIQVKLAYFENQPLAQWVTVLSGNGLYPPSNYFLWPRGWRESAGSSADPTARRPYYGMDIAHIPISNTQFLPSSIPGYMTVSLTAYLGWPAVPDLIKDITCKLATRMWRARAAGFNADLGANETGRILGVQLIRATWDPLDDEVLNRNNFKVIHL